MMRGAAADVAKWVIAASELWGWWWQWFGVLVAAVVDEVWRLWWRWWWWLRFGDYGGDGGG